MPRLRYYISGHGLGHASRSCQILHALRAQFPEITLEVCSDAADWFLRDNLPPGIPVSRCNLDVGVIQTDSLEMNLPKTLTACQELIAASDRLVRAESSSLGDARVDLVVADVSAVAGLAARSAGIPSVLVSNFSWDWIYQGFAEQLSDFSAVADWYADAYRQSDRILRLPFGAPFVAGPVCEDLPLVARLSQKPAEEVCKTLGVPAGHKLALFSFGGFGLDGTDLAGLAELDDWHLLAEAELAAQSDYLTPLPEGVAYPDLVNAADVVITKPGYGIVAECIAHRTTVLYTSRGAFREQQLLVEGLHRYTRARGIDNRPLRAGRITAPLRELLAQPEPTERLATDGAAIAARRLAAMLGVGGSC